jgi:hypothetical protein
MFDYFRDRLAIIINMDMENGEETNCFFFSIFMGLWSEGFFADKVGELELGK